MYALSRLSIGTRCSVGREALDRAAGDALRRRVGRDEIGVFGFERFQFLQQRVELVVGDFRIVVDVVALFVVANLFAKVLEPGGGSMTGSE